MLTKTDLSQIQNIVHTDVESQLKPIKKALRKIKSDLDIVGKTLDRDYVSLRRKVDEHIVQHSAIIN